MRFFRPGGLWHSGWFARVVASIGLVSASAHADLRELDLDFGVRGIAQVEIPESLCPASLACEVEYLNRALQPDGKILLAADFYSHQPAEWGKGGHVSAGVLRRLPNGTVDTAFASGGFALFDGPRPVASRSAAQVLLLPSGKLMMAGVLRPAADRYPDTRLRLVRLNADGSRDAAFGDGGVLDLPVGSGPTSIASLHLHLGGLLVGTNEWLENGSRLRFFRFDLSGVRDPTFNAAAVSPVIASFLHHVDVAPDGSIVTAAFPRTFGHTDVARLDGAGNLAPAFGTGGIARIEGFFVRALRIDPDGRPVLSGNLESGGYRLLRLSGSGVPDASFGNGGMTSSGDFNVTSLAFAADGRILGAGRSEQTQFLHLRRWWPNGHGDPLTATGEVRVEMPTYLSNFATVYVDPQADGGVLLSALVWPQGRFTILMAQLGGFTRDINGDAYVFVQQQYRDLLGREGDAAGIEYWARRILGGMPREEVMASFLASPEFQGRVAPVARLYLAYFQRVPDYEGLSFWRRYLAAGNPMHYISGVFANSAEFAATYGRLDDRAFVELVYRNVLGRAPDPEGLAYWMGELGAGRISRGDLMFRFSESPEFVALTRSEVFVVMAYAGLLQRAPDPAGYDYWVGVMDGGDPGLGLLRGFLTAPEYQSRFVP